MNREKTTNSQKVRKKRGSRSRIFLAIGALAGILLGGTSSASVANEFPLVVTDGSGKEVRISKRPGSIISLAPSNTEILFALDLEDTLVAVSEYCNYPPEVQDKPKIGGFSTINIEKVVSFEPDLVLATGGVQKTIVEDLERLGLTVIGLNARNIEDVVENILLVGKATGRVESARRLRDNLEERIGTVTSKTQALLNAQRPRVFYEVQYEPLMTAGPGAFAHDLIHLAGGMNIASDSLAKYPVFSLEILIERNPEVIIVSWSHGTIASSVEGVRSRKRWQIMDAVKNNRVYGIHADLVSRPGPRIVDGLEEIAKCIHPELFKK